MPQRRCPVLPLPHACLHHRSSLIVSPQRGGGRLDLRIGGRSATRALLGAEAALALLVRAGGRGGDAMDAAIAVATREGAKARVGEGGVTPWTPPSQAAVEPRRARGKGKRRR